MTLIDIVAPRGSRRDRFFARSVGTRFAIIDPQENEDATTIELYDEIGTWGVNAKDFRSQLKGAGDVVLKINSPGGDVFDGIAMYNDLVQHKGNVRVEVNGIAASIASIIAMGGKQIAMAPNAMMMIHNSWTVAAGNADDFEEQAAVLGKIDNALALTYANQKGTPGIRTIKQMMSDETWFSGKEAVDNGFATELLSAPADNTAQAKFDLTPFANVPKAMLWSDETFEAGETEDDIVKVLMRDAAYTRARAKAFIKSARAGNTSKTEIMPGADDVSIEGLLSELRNWTVPTT
jgi:ATP-dependent Clp protease, protease subunit